LRLCSLNAWYLFVGWALSNHFIAVMRAFWQELKKHQRKWKGRVLLILCVFVEKRLNRECLVGDLVCFPVCEACYLHRIGGDYLNRGKSFP